MTEGIAENPTRHDCGKICTREPGSFGTGYAVIPPDVPICYDCATKRQRDELEALPHGKGNVFVAYVDEKARTVTTWTGANLARITSYRESRNGWHGSTIASVQAVTPDGKRLYGKGPGKNMYVRLRAAK